VLTIVAVLAMSQLDPLVRAAAEPALKAHNACKQRSPAQCQVAREAYVSFLAAHPGSALEADMRFFYAELLYDQLDDYRGAARLYREVLALPSNRWSWSASINLIHALSELSASDDEMVAACDALVARFPDRPNSLSVALKAVNVLSAAGRVREAELRLEAMLRRWPDADTGRALSGLYRIQNDVHGLAAAVRRFRRAPSGVLDGFKQTLDLWSAELESAGRFGDAAELAFEEGALGDNSLALLHSASLYVQAGELEHALSAAERVGSAEALMMRALISARLGRHEAAAKLFAQAGKAAEAEEREEQEAAASEDPGGRFPRRAVTVSAPAPSRSRKRHR
jgi:tetratricopeptide (TPR) repeat protein